MDTMPGYGIIMGSNTSPNRACKEFAVQWGKGKLYQKITQIKNLNITMEKWPEGQGQGILELGTIPKPGSGQ